MDCCCKPSIILIPLQNFSGLQGLNLEQHFIDSLSIMNLVYNLTIGGTCVNFESKREAVSSASAFLVFFDVLLRLLDQSAVSAKIITVVSWDLCTFGFQESDLLDFHHPNPSKGYKLLIHCIQPFHLKYKVAMFSW